MSDLFLFRNGLRDFTRPRRLVWPVVLSLLPALLAILWRTLAVDFHPDIAYNTLEAGMVFGFVLVVLSVVFCTDVVAQEVERRTIVYLLTRPVPRWRILLARFAAALLVTLVAAAAASFALALATCGPAHFGDAHFGHDVKILTVGALAYGALFLLLATLLNRPLTYGLLFAFGWETWVPSLPGRFGKVSVMAHLRVLAPHPLPESGGVDLTALMTALNPVEITPSYAWRALLGVILVALPAALVVFSLREYAPRDDVG